MILSVLIAYDDGRWWVGWTEGDGDGKPVHRKQRLTSSNPSSHKDAQQEAATLLGVSLRTVLLATVDELDPLDE
jgi:hypothetical protein